MFKVETWSGARVALVVALLFVRQEQPRRPERPAPPQFLASESKAFAPFRAITLTEHARSQDDVAYGEYLHVRETLIARGELGHWLAIVDGKLLPRAANRESLAPAESLEVLLFLVDPDHTAAKHRYLFRIGEEGDVAYHYFAPNLPWSDALGVGLFRATFLDEPGSDVVFAPESVQLTRGSNSKRKSFEFGAKGIALTLADPTGATKVESTVTPSSACDGTIVLSSETAERLGLERFEIPGVCWYGPDGGERFACRRARLRWRVPELDLDATVPVAIWPRRGDDRRPDERGR
jgi:hypothetical protein